MQSLKNSYGVYEILKGSNLFCPISNLEDAVNSLTKEDIYQLSKDIVDFHKKNIPIVIDDLKESRKAFNAYPFAYNQKITTEFLRPLCLYAEKIVIQDPIYNLLYNPAYVKPNFEAIKSSLQRQIPFLVEIEPLVKAGILHLFPLRALQPPLLEQISNSIETDLNNNLWKNKIVKNIKYQLYPESNLLFISLGKPIGNNYHCFRYGKFGNIVEDNQDELKVEMFSPDSLLDNDLNISSEEIQSWISSEINNEIVRTTTALNENLFLSEALNTSMVTNHQLCDELLTMKGDIKSNNVGNLLPFLTKLRIPFVDNISLDKVVNLREKEQDSFLDFRLALQDMCMKIEKTNPSNAETVTQQIIDKSIQPQIRELDRELKSIRTKAIIRGIPRAALAFGTLVVSVSTGNQVLSALGSIGFLKLFKDVTDEYSNYLSSKIKLKNNSMHFLWRVKRESNIKPKKGYTNDGFPERVEIPLEVSKKMGRHMDGLGIKVYDNVSKNEKVTDNKDSK